MSHRCDKVVKVAAGNYTNGIELIRLLLEKRGRDIKITDEVVKVTAGNREEIMELLLDQRGGEIRITDEVLQVAATNGHERTLKLINERYETLPPTEK